MKVNVVTADAVEVALEKQSAPTSAQPSVRLDPILGDSDQDCNQEGFGPPFPCEGGVSDD